MVVPQTSFQRKDLDFGGLGECVGIWSLSPCPTKEWPAEDRRPPSGEYTLLGGWQPQIAESEVTFQLLPSPRKDRSLLAGPSAWIDLSGDAEQRGTACGFRLLHGCWDVLTIQPAVLL